MTQRERQILNWIEADPMISQQELAERAGITRSSVAVHISNLMKKGCIAGKGYIVTRSPYVTVVGGMNMDIGGWPSEELVAQDSNPGRVRMSPGGVGRNIAHNNSLRRRCVRPEAGGGVRRAGHRYLPVPGDPRRSHLHLSFHQ